MESVKNAIAHLGGLGAAAKAIGVSPQALNQWVNGARPVPIERCVVIERLTEKRVTRQQLRPDDWPAIWPELAEGAAA